MAMNRAITWPISCNYANAPWKTRKRVHQSMTTLYDNTPEGLSGNEDCGQMSAWYVFSANSTIPM